MKFDKKNLLLYAVTDRSWLNGGTLANAVSQALEGGATTIQLREKELATEESLEEAKDIKSLCEQYCVTFIINDNVDLAVAVDADGVHVGQKDRSTSEVRKLIGQDKILGVSAQTVEQALLAEQEGADYLGVGAVFPTGSKDDAKVISHEVLREICRAVHIPVVAIGGITKDNLMELSGSGTNGIAVISAIFAQPDIAEAAAQLKKLTDRMVNTK